MEENKCMICEKEVATEEWKRSFVNAAVLGDYIELQGHLKCVHNVTNLVVVPNRIRLGKLASAK